VAGVTAAPAPEGGTTAAPAPRILVFGDVCLHVTVRPNGDSDFCAGEVVLGPGGSSAMVAAQVAALDHPVSMVGVAGDDHIAVDLRRRLAAGGVDCARWTFVPGDTAQVAILVGAGGDHRVVVEQGGVTGPGEALAAAAREIPVPDGAWCYVPGFPGYDAIRLALTERGVRLVCDFGFRPWLTDARTVTENILERVAGVTVAVCSGASFGERENHALARACLDGGATGVVTSLGRRGCLVSDAGGTGHVPGFPTDPVNTLGAGDSLVAGLLVALAGGRSLRQACVFGQAVAASKITTLARPAAIADVHALLDTVGWSR
jgi:sugar/nucleoside kinase (ribokinase family)